MVGESFIEQFAAISLKRRHGVLRVLASGAAYELWFHDGKIVEVRASLGKDAQEICARLVRSHELHEKVYDLVGKKKVSIAQLFDLLVSRNFAEPKQFHRAKRAHDLDLIHTIGLSADAVLEFQSQDVRPDPRFPVSLSPGQLLLDLCELQQDEEKFQSNFGGNQCGTTRVSRRTDEVKGLCDFEQAVWDMIEQSRQIGELFQTLLSEYEVKEGLLGLLEKSLLTVETEASLASRALVKEEDDFRLGEVEEEPDLWSKIADDAVGSMLKDFDDLLALREEVESPPTVREPEAPRSEPSEPEREQIPEVSAQDEMLEDESGVASPELESLCQELREAYTPGKSKRSVSKKDNEATPIRIDANESLFALVLTFIRISARHGTERALFEMNHLFLEQSRLEKIILVTLLAYLFALLGFCLLGGFVDNFLVSLADFSSEAFLSVLQ